jgi:ribosomal protein L32
MRVTKGHRNNRRAHHALKAPRLSLCSNCGAYHQRHRVCLECGFYKGEQILDIVKVKKAESKAEVKTEKKETKKTVSKKGDDLTKIEGIGPKTAEALNKAKIKTFADLADSKVGDLRDILEGASLSKYDPKT